MCANVGWLVVKDWAVGGSWGGGASREWSLCGARGLCFHFWKASQLDSSRTKVAALVFGMLSFALFYMETHDGRDCVRGSKDFERFGRVTERADETGIEWLSTCRY